MGIAAGISAAGIKAGENGARGASIASLPGANGSGRAANQPGAGDGFGAMMKAAMAGQDSRAQAGGQETAKAGHEPAGEVAGGSAKQHGAHVSPAKADAGTPAPKMAKAAESAAAAAEKKLPAQVPVSDAAGGDPAGTPAAGTKTGAKTAAAGQAGAPGDGSPAAVAQESAASGAAREARLGEMAKLGAGAGEKGSGTVTNSGKDAKAMAATVSDGETNASAGGSTKPGGAADGKIAGKRNEKTDLKKDAGKVDAKGAGAAHAMMLPAAASAAPAGQTAVSAAGSARAQGDAKREKGAVTGAAGASGAAAGNAAGVTAQAAVLQAKRAMPPGAGSGAASGSAVGSSGGNAPSTNLNQDAAGGGAANVASGNGAGVGASAGPVVASSGRQGAGLVAGAGREAQPVSAQGGSGATAAHRENVTVKGANSSGSGSGGFAATLLQGHAGFATAHPGGPHAAGTAAGTGGAGAANPYARMDETQGHALVFASPQKMSVAVTDPSLGSFQVRAQNAGAQVAASLATASAATHAQLSGHLPSLTAFLQDQRVDVARVTVVQQGSLLGGDAGPRDFGGQSQGRSGSSGARGRRARAAGAGSVGSVGSVSSGGPVAAAGRTEVPGAAMETVAGSGSEMAVAAQGSGSAAAGGGMASVDLMA